MSSFPRKVVSSLSKSKIGRDSKTGTFIRVKEALRRPTTTTVETIVRPTKKTR